jgi:transcriptional regulator with XRE-family HTH domain
MHVTPIKLRRIERGLLQLEVAAGAAIDRSRLSMIENGWKQATDDELRRIAHVLKTPVASLAD